MIIEPLSSSRKILITGVNGFIGSAIGKHLAHSDTYDVRGSVRVISDSINENVVLFETGSINASTDWNKALAGIDCVIHTAGLAHNKCTSADEERAFREINVKGTTCLAKQAVACGVKRFVFLSSIGVYGEFSREALKEGSALNPVNSYARSKLDAEEALLQICASSGMECVIVRPPLVYAWDAPGNFKRLLSLLRKVPLLPFKNVDNHRSFVSLKNLVSFISLCTYHSAAANEIFVIADDEKLSTPQFMSILASGLNTRVTFFPVKDSWLYFGAKITGRKGFYHQLVSSLEIDNSKAKKILGWAPVVSAETGLEEAAAKYKQSQNY